MNIYQSQYKKSLILLIVLLVLALGATVFLSFFFFILGAQNFSAGTMSRAVLNIAICLAAITGAGISIIHLLRLRQSLARCKYL